MSFPHETCKICKNIPDISETFSKYGHDDFTSSMPAEAATLKIVGAPFFNDNTNGSNHCLKQCPHCGTYYAWDHTYEFLVNGSEDSTILTRLDQKEGEQRADTVMKKLKAFEEDFQGKLGNAIQAFNKAEDFQSLVNAVDFIHYWGSMKGGDYSFALPVMVTSLIHLPRDEKHQSILFTLESALETLAERNQTHISEILTFLKSGNAPQDDKYIRWLVTKCSNLTAESNKIRKKK